MSLIESFLTSFVFRLDTYTWLEVLDVLLVTALTYVVITLLRRSKAAFLLRGVLVLVVVLLALTLFLPLPTFGALMGFVLLAMVIIMPITLQPELRRLLEQIGRRIGFGFTARPHMAAEITPVLVRGVEALSASATGGLVVIEGSTPLDEVIDSGVQIEGQLTPELLQTLFFDKTPLHDGAIVVRGDTVVAAGCVLPLTEQKMPQKRRRLGMRHRAAMGMSEQADALVIIVSEETGIISTAWRGTLYSPMDRAALHQQIVEFYADTSRHPGDARWPWQNVHLRFPGWRSLLTSLGYLLVSFLLALAASAVVREQTNPLVVQAIGQVPLQVIDMPPGAALTDPLPQAVTVAVQTTAAVWPTLGPNSLRASVDLGGLESGYYRIPVDVSTDVDKVAISSVSPAEVDVNISPVISRTIPVQIQIEDVDQLSAAYEASGSAITTPSEVVIVGPESQVSLVDHAFSAISVANATATLSELRPLIPVDALGQPVDEVELDPDQAEVTVIVRRRINARDVGVRVVTTGAPPEGYWLSGLSVDPASVTVQGNPNTLIEMNSFVDTLPVDLNDVTGVLRLDVLLDLPPDVSASDSSGEPVQTVAVVAQVEARTGDLLTTRPVELINSRDTMTVAFEPQDVELLLSGPLPVLNQIELQPDLVRVLIDALSLQPNTSQEVEPEIILPEGVEAQLINNSILVTTESN